ncbi:hypothetical protein SEUCBS140593_009098 [Sporothrix eucalyptigena]|uniref:Attractin/MKLN-like beta-propeller domain-containing protein n=1 Tax=Sporothrix eucalyptigena TaxID=1812306 RepID=A0ABP0CUB6_9PEZI
MSTYPGNYSNTWLLYQDLDHDAPDVGMPQIYANLSKNSTIPDVNGGYLWGDEVNKYFYLFGGEYFQQTPVQGFLLYAYDIINNFWLQLDVPQTANIAPVSYGAGTAVSSRGEGYYYGGWLSNNSVFGWGADNPPVATDGLVKYNFDKNSWTNITGPDTVRRAEGIMVFIPAGDGGMLVYLGGITDLYGNGTVTGQGLDTIFLYDVLSSKWYTQTASGTIPGDRRRFCAGVTWAEDQSSYNIYLYGGASMPPNTSGYDDLYVLTMPTFTWIKLYPTDGNVTGQYPHHSLTCNVVSGAQMLIIGGTFPLSSDCDVPQQWGTHNADLTEAFDPNKALWQLYAPNETTYVVPDVIVSAIGGGPTGGATKTAPANGWGSPDLPVLMTKTASIAARTPTRSIPAATGSGNGNSKGTTHLATGAIVGIAIGGLVAVLLLGFGCWTCLRRYRERRGVDGQLGVVPPGGGGRRFGRRGRRRPFNGSQSGYADPAYYGGNPVSGSIVGPDGRVIMMMQPPPHNRYTDAPTPPGGWSPQHGSPYSLYAPPSPYGPGYDPNGQPNNPQYVFARPPVELAASNGSGYMHLTPVGSVLDSGSNTATGTGSGTGTGTGSSGTYDVANQAAGGKSPSEHGSGRRVWTAQVSEVQIPPPRRSSNLSGGVPDRRRATGSDGGSPLARAQELSADAQYAQERPGQEQGPVHNTYYHP